MKTKFKFPALCILLLFGAHLLGAPNGADTDSTKGKYPINDPRNPNCPCHQYQAQADKEFAQLLKTSGKGRGDLEVKGEAFGSAKRVKKVHNFHWFWSSAKPRNAKAPKHKRFKDRLSRCFHF